MKAAREREEQQEEQDIEGYDERNMDRDYQPAEASSREKKPERDFKKTLEEILLGEEIIEEVQSDPVQHYPKSERNQVNTDQVDGPKKNVYQKYYDNEMLEGSLEDMDEEPQKLEDTIDELEEDMVLQEEDTIEEGDEKTDFDLRQAIIYSEIINRRYN